MLRLVSGPVHVARVQLLHPAHQHRQPRDHPDRDHDHHPRQEPRHAPGQGIR